MSGTPLMQLYDHRGRRKYLTPTERSCFATAAARRCKRDAALCLLIHFTGCRLSEALHLTDDQIQREDRMIVLRSLKKRGKTHFRAIPVPQSLITLLDTLPRVPGEACVFTMHRATAWRVIKSVLAECRIEGAQACPRGLRHGYGVGALMKGVAVTKLQKLMGHANLATTAIYLDVCGKEEREMVSAMWEPQFAD